MHETLAEKQAQMNECRADIQTPACLMAYYGKPLTFFKGCSVYMLITLCECGNLLFTQHKTGSNNQITELHTHWDTHIHMLCTVKKHTITSIFLSINTTAKLFKLSSILHSISISLLLLLSRSVIMEMSKQADVRACWNTKHTLYLLSLVDTLWGVWLRNWGQCNVMMS